MSYMKTQNENFLVVLHDKLQTLDNPSVFASFETVSHEIIEVDKIPARNPKEYQKKISPFGKVMAATKTQTDLTGLPQKKGFA